MKWLTEWAVTSSALILIVLAARYLLRNKLSARLRYALWGMVLLRLLVPFQLELPAPVSDSLPVLASNFAPQVEDVELYTFRTGSQPLPEEDLQGMRAYGLDTGSVAAYEVTSQTIGGLEVEYRHHCAVLTETGFDTYSFYTTLPKLLTILWAMGTGLAALVVLLSNLRFARRLRKRRERLEGADAPIPVYTAAQLSSPCLFGVLRPAVYMTREAAENSDTLRHVLAHELTHYAHFDHLWSLLRCLALALHWYNPLVWLAVELSKQDGELACDEGAVARLGEEERIPYGRTLVDMVAARSLRPVDLLSCSTAMTGGGKSVKQRVAQLVKKPETAKTALFAAVAVVALSAVFVFTSRADNGKPGDYQTFKFDITSAQSIHLSREMTSSYEDPTVITDPELLEQAKDILSHGASDWLSAPSVLEREELNLDSLCTLTLTVRGGRKVRYQFARLDLAEQGPLLESHFCVFTEGSLSSIHGNRIAALLDREAVPKIYELMRQQSQQNGSNSPELDSFLTDLENASSIRYYPPLYSSQFYPDSITDPDLLALTKERLSVFVPLEPDDPIPDQRKQMDSSRIVLASEDKETHYSLLLWDDYTYLFKGDPLSRYLDSKTGETSYFYEPILRTRSKTNVINSIASYARRQSELLQDPSIPVLMSRAELSKHTPEGIWEAIGYRLQGWDGDLKDAEFHAGYTSPTDIQLWYYGDESHGSCWVLQLMAPTLSSNPTGYTVLSDQPIEVFNSIRYASEEEPYEQLGPGAFAASLKPEDVTGMYLSQGGAPVYGERITTGVEEIKELAVQGLYHQFSAEYDEEKYGQYCLTIQVEKDVGYYLKDGGTDGLILSIGSEPDAVCLRHRILANPQGEMHQFVRSPELYASIASLARTQYNRKATYETFLDQAEGAVSIRIETGDGELTTITDPQRLEEARAALLAAEPLPEDADDLVGISEVFLRREVGAGLYAITLTGETGGTATYYINRRPMTNIDYFIFPVKDFPVENEQTECSFDRIGVLPGQASYALLASANTASGRIPPVTDTEKSDTDSKKDEWEKQQIADYQAAGVTMDGKNYYYQGQLVNIFLDIRANQSFYTLDTNPAGAVNVKIIRDKDDKISGVEYMDDEEAAALLADLRGD